MNRRIDDSLVAVNLAAMSLTKALVEVPFRAALPSDLFELIQQVTGESEQIMAQYVMAHPIRVATGSFVVDPKFWSVWMASAMVRPVQFEVTK